MTLVAAENFTFNTGVGTLHGQKNEPILITSNKMILSANHTISSFSKQILFNPPKQLRPSSGKCTQTSLLKQTKMLEKEELVATLSCQREGQSKVRKKTRHWPAVVLTRLSPNSKGTKWLHDRSRPQHFQAPWSENRKPRRINTNWSDLHKTLYLKQSLSNLWISTHQSLNKKLRTTDQNVPVKIYEIDELGAGKLWVVQWKKWNFHCASVVLGTRDWTKAESAVGLLSLESISKQIMPAQPGMSTIESESLKSQSGLLRSYLDTDVCHKEKKYPPNIP